MTRVSGHVYLTGYRGSGKTSVGRLLGQRLSLAVIDLDDCVEAAAGMSIREIFEQEGEAGFRDRESAALQDVVSQSAGVISLGGGAILREENRRLIAKTGFCVWLKADVDTVLERLTRDATTNARRPALTTLPQREEILAMLTTREPIYQSVSNVSIDVTGKQVAEIADEVIASLPGL